MREFFEARNQLPDIFSVNERISRIQVYIAKGAHEQSCAIRPLGEFFDKTKSTPGHIFSQRKDISNSSSSMGTNLRQCLKNRRGYRQVDGRWLGKGGQGKQVEEEGEHDRQLEQEGKNSKRYIPPNILLLPPFLDTVVPYAAFETHLSLRSWLYSLES